MVLAAGLTFDVTAAPDGTDEQTDEEASQSAAPDDPTVETTTPDTVAAPDTTVALDDPPASTTPTTTPATTTPPTTITPPTTTPATTTPPTEPTVPPTTAESPETTAPPTTELAPTTSVPADEPEVSPMSSGPGGSSIRVTQTFYAYVEPGENLDVAFSKVAPGVGTDLTITVRGPGGFTDSCTVAGADPVGSDCSWSDLTAPSAGVWQIDFEAAESGLANDYFSWNVDVQSGTTSIPGRVYSNRFVMAQGSGTVPIDVSLWYQSQHGFLYGADYLDYNGIDSTFISDATGVADLNTCVSAYESIDGGGPNSDTGEFWVPSHTSPGTCGDPYKIFFENPDSSLPATAQLWDGSSVWLKPPVTLPDLSNLTFTPDSPTARSGEVNFDVANFTGQLDILVDANGDGDYTDPEDRTLPVAVTQDGTMTVPFDGLDGQGNPIPETQEINARVAITQAGEIHFVNSDVETRSGLQVQALNGPNAGSTTIYWDDTNLDPAGRIGTIPPPDGTGGVDSSGGVHGWICDVSADPCNANNGVNGSWGDVRNIDDWTYHTIDEFEEIVIPGAPLPPFECTSNAPGILFQQFPTDAWEGDLVTGQFDEVASEIEDSEINGIGYNVLDDYVYGWSNTNRQWNDGDFPTGLVRIGSDYSVQYLGLPPGWNEADYVNTGDVDDEGHYWAAGIAIGNLWWEIDLEPGSPTFGEVLDSGAIVQPAGLTMHADWSYNPTDGLLYGMAHDAGGTLHLVSFDRTTHVVSDEGSLNLPGGAAPTFGATFMDADGFLYGSQNVTGEIYRVDTANVTATFFSQGPVTELNDGARCPSPIYIDLGDAPDSYGTELGSNGPRHGIPNYDENTGEAPLMLGATIDPEIDGVPTPDADGDDAADTDDEDGVSGAIVVRPGQPTTVAVSATNNTNEDATLAGWIDNPNGTFEAAELQTITVPANSGAADYQLTFPAGTAPADTYARFRLFPGGTDPADILPTGPASAGEVEDYPVPYRVLEIDKDSDATADTRIGDTVTYTVIVTNAGSGDYTATDPASIKDDLTDVLDDGTYNDDATASAGTVSYAEPKLSWSGPLAAGDSVTITYTVTLNKAGDLNVDNTAYQTDCDATDPDCDPPTPEECVDGVDPATGLACDPEEYDLPHLTLDKASPDITTARVGDTIHYTITATSDGEADYTDARPAGFIDDLSGVLDDATYNNDEAASVGTVTFTDPRLRWTAALAVGESATITYSVVYTGEGDNHIDNIVFEPPCDPSQEDCDPPPPEECVDGIDPATGLACDPIEEPKPNLELDKTSPDITQARVGDTVTYTITATNTGPGDYTQQNPASYIDDLSGVLDDATYNDDATASAGTVSYDEPRIGWTGALASGDSVTLTYTVTLIDGGDRHVDNVVFGTQCDPADPSCDPPPPDCPPEGKDPNTHMWVDCIKEPLPKLEIDKSSPDLATAQVGDTVQYTVELTNVGPGDFTQDRLGRAIDDMSGVLDDATYNDDATASAGNVSYTQPRLVWTGPLAAGDSVTITYSVTLTGEGDLQVDNIAFEPPCDPTQEDCDPPPPEDCVDGVNPDTGLACDPENGELAKLKILKVSGASSAAYGDTVKHTVTVENTGGVDFTEQNPAEVVDDLTDVLDDAAWVGDAEASVGSLSYSDPQLTWTGPLAVGDTVTFTYSVTVNSTATGSGDLYNVVSSNTGDNNCPEGSADPDCDTNTPLESSDPPDPPAPPAPPSPVTPGYVPVTG